MMSLLTGPLLWRVSQKSALQHMTNKHPGQGALKKPCRGMTSCTCQQHVEPVIVLGIALSTSAGHCRTACMCTSAGQIIWAFMQARASTCRHDQRLPSGAALPG